jgi:hypothetical protein
VRQRRGPARARDDLADLGLGEQDEVEPDLPHRPGRHGERRAQLGDAAARRVPRQLGRAEAERRGQLRRHARAVRAQRGERARGAAELGVEARAGQPGAGVERRVEPARGLQAEGGR